MSDLIQLLTADGVRVEHPDVAFSPDPSLLDTYGDEPGVLRALLRDMTLVRRFDVEATALQRHGELGLWPSSLGQEAAQIGAGRALAPGDYVFPTYRDHGIAWCRRIDPVDLLGVFRGTDHVGWDPEEKRYAPVTIVIGAHTLHAVGYALGALHDGAVGTGDASRDTAVLACFGDGATSQGDVNEAMVFAASYHVPVVFFLQNNHWAISEPVTRQSRIPLVQRAAGFGFPGYRVDGNDVLATYAVVQRALEHARTGQGPVLVEAVTYRMGAHTTTDDPTRYRTDDDLEVWRRRDPIDRLARYLRTTGGADDAWFAALEAEADELGADVRARCHALPDPSPLVSFDATYAEITPTLAAQRAEVAALLDGTEVAR
ncbi:thiamine pyrophosphate-dependent dehydrogenase E1 component subunit alpha [Nocardioides jiangxiensis]|uniref:2-oxoisovalerate dehydrogenase subunit alpha n=1 Tax=Nocardioides jiangxiensis TaxID=3064524 RepID=A0ABT9B0L6_9ACTN|nr:thiamine pyrophosphate-dependent dehydrogenase E1 component subunit alpha [Nocardioides sp. WY-20]MDO7868401.1 thiamine pyrophosphate-dependent dehydrogenase E1 component subunit alpha [Nocardioides sp. WY-20]